MSTTGIRLNYMLNPGDQLGVYKIIRPLGAGGMGEVYLAEHVHMRKHYAIKVLPGDLSGDPQFIDRFRIEARVMADLEHTNIVRVHNFGDEKGRQFLVMDYVEGPDGNPRTLEDELAWGRNLPESAVREIALQICDGLAYAHGFKGEGVIHRDLKPANILIAKPTHKAHGDYAVKISDFGLAKILGADYIRTVLERSTTLTGVKTPLPLPDDKMTQPATTPTSPTFSLLGTYDYMSPEQKTGMAIDARSDIFSVGIILYRMLTGHKPEGSFDLPSKKGLNRAWDKIIEKCLRRESSRRYASISALRADIAKVGTPFYKSTAFLAGGIAAGLLVVITATHLIGRSGLPQEPVIMGAGAAAISSPAATAVPDRMVPPANTPEPIPVPSPVSMPVPTPKVQASVPVVASEVASPTPTMPPPTPSATPAPVVMEPAPTVATPPRVQLGKVHVRSNPGVLVTVESLNHVTMRLGETPENGVLKDLSIPAGSYTLRLIKSNHVTRTFNIAVLDGQEVEIDAELDGMPGRLLVTSGQPVDVLWDGRRIGRSGSVITNLPAGSHTFTIMSGNSRNANLEVVIPPNGYVVAPAPALVKVAAYLRIRAAPSPRYQDAKLPSHARVRIGNGAWMEVGLPFETTVSNVTIRHVVALEMDQYQKPNPQTVTVADGQSAEIVFHMEPLQANVLFMCNVEADVVAVRETWEPSFFQSARKLTGIGAIKGRTGERMSLEPFQKYRIEVSAPGYKSEILELSFENPGREFRQSIKLTPLPRGEVDTDTSPFKRPRAH
ncbi:MAG: protein kinase [Lentisphaerota bacterium]